jgi:hypothetical protein
MYCVYAGHLTLVYMLTCIHICSRIRSHVHKDWLVAQNHHTKALFYDTWLPMITYCDQDTKPASQVYRLRSHTSPKGIPPYQHKK